MNCFEKCCCSCVQLNDDSAQVLRSSVQLDTAVQSKAVYPHCSPSSYLFHCSSYLLYRQIYFVNCNWVDTQWQGYSTHLHTHTQNNTIKLGRVWAVPRLFELYPGICLTTEKIARKNLSPGSRRVPVGTMQTEYTEKNIHSNKTKETTMKIHNLQN
jgi:hypothetical protein